MRYRAESVNANRIANGIISSLVSITAGCAFVNYWGAVIIGCKLHSRSVYDCVHVHCIYCALVVGVLVYHFGCYLEYKFKIEDTASVVPVHGMWYVGSS